MAFVISLEVMADVIMLPAEALVRAISQTTGMKFGNQYEARRKSYHMI